MRRCMLGLVWVPFLIALEPASAMLPTGPTETHVSVKPPSGGPRTTFRLSFRVADATGTSGFLRRSDALIVTAPNRPGCISRVTLTLSSAQAGARRRIMLDPSRLHGIWCAGTFLGAIIESQTVVCRPAMACPDFEVAPRTIARFRFQVTRGRSVTRGGQTAPFVASPRA
jgi:hypothetical protein